MYKPGNKMPLIAVFLIVMALPFELVLIAVVVAIGYYL